MRLVTLPNGARINPEHVVDVEQDAFGCSVTLTLVHGKSHVFEVPIQPTLGQRKALCQRRFDDLCSLIDGPSWIDQIKNGIVGVNRGMQDWTTTMVPATEPAVPLSAVTTAVDTGLAVPATPTRTGFEFTLPPSCTADLGTFAVGPVTVNGAVVDGVRNVRIETGRAVSQLPPDGTPLYWSGNEVCTASGAVIGEMRNGVVVPKVTDRSMLDAVLDVYPQALVVNEGAEWEVRVWPTASTSGRDYTQVGWGMSRDDAILSAVRIINAKKQIEIDQRRQDHACKVCGNMPDADGYREHGRGCYAVDADGGGSDFCDLKTAAKP